MKAQTLILVSLLLIVGAAAPVAAAPPGIPDPPPGFGTCHLEEESAGTLEVGPYSVEILIPKLQCYW